MKDGGSLKKSKVTSKKNLRKKGVDISFTIKILGFLYKTPLYCVLICD